MQPWDFTLYVSLRDVLVMKVMFAECEYKADVGRYSASSARVMSSWGDPLQATESPKPVMTWCPSVARTTSGCEKVRRCGRFSVTERNVS